MVNPYRNEASVEIGGKSYLLRANMVAMAEFEFALKIRGIAELRQRFSNMGFKELIAMLRAMSRAANNEIPNDVIETLEISDFDMLLGPIITAMAGYEGAEKNAAAAPAAKAAKTKNAGNRASAKG